MALTIENHVYREGEGIPLILVHGFPVDHRMGPLRHRAHGDVRCAGVYAIPDLGP